MKKYLLGLLCSLWVSAASAGVTCTVPFNLQNNTTADATQVMANYNAILACLLNAAHAGANSDITSLTGLTTPLTPAEGGSTVYVGTTSTGGANAQIVAAPVPIGFTKTAGNQIIFLAGFTNTGATQFNINGTGLTDVYHPTPGGNEPLSGGEIVAGDVVIAVYDGTRYVLPNTSNQLGGYGTAMALTASSTTDLSLAPNHNATINGATTITSFGANALTALPCYRMTFSGALTLTNNASSLIVPGAANITTAANDTATACYLGSGNWQVVNYTKASGAGVIAVTPLCGASGLAITNNAGTPTTSIDLSARSVVLLNSASVPLTVNSVSLTLNATTGTGGTSTANGMDGSARPTSNWVYLYIISDGNTTASLGSTSSTAPTLPSGYSYSCRLGTALTDSSQNFRRFTQTGNTTNWNIAAGVTNNNTLRYVVTGAFGTSCNSTSTGIGYNVQSLANFVPPTATDAHLSAGGGYSNGGAAYVCVTPSASDYGGVASTNHPPFWASGNAIVSSNDWFKMTTAQTLYASSSGSGGYLAVLGYKDSVNAN